MLDSQYNTGSCISGSLENTLSIGQHMKNNQYFKPASTLKTALGMYNETNSVCVWGGGGGGGGGLCLFSTNIRK